MHNQIQVVPAGLTDALARNELSELIRPYLRYVEGWQLRASYLRAQFSVHPAGSSEHELAERRLGELRREIRASRAHLLADTSRLPPDDRVDVVIEELDGLLLATSAWLPMPS